jgi:pyruvate dehydrogenase E2 component (dihydrolipoamide acetyltransferase)
MASDVTMPRLSDSMEEGTVLKWLVEEGGDVKRGEPLVEIETDKANMTYEADADGTLIEIVAQEGDTLAIGETIARIGDPSEAGEKSAKKEKAADDGAEAKAEGDGGEKGEGDKDGGEDEDGEAEEGEAEEGEAEGGEAESEEADGKETEEREPVGAEAKGEARGAAGAGDGGGETQAGAGTATKERAPSNGDGGRVKASPVARRMARELGVELARLEGSGPGGRIVKADVQAAAESGAAAPGDGDGAKAETAEAPREERAPEPQRGEAGAKGEAQIQELTRLQQTVSRRMAESK